MKPQHVNTIKSFAKLAGAGAVVFGVGFAMIVQDPKVEEVGPPTVSADITDFASAPSSNSAKFTEAMAALGMRPRVYDYNGNVMYFAVGQSDQRPAQLVNTIQNQLVSYGVNQKNNTDARPISAAMNDPRLRTEDSSPENVEATLQPYAAMAEEILGSGDVYPTHISADRFEMVGYDSSARNVDELTAAFAEDHSDTKVRNLIGGYKYIDGFWDEKTQQTEVTAVWSGDEFLAARMDGEGMGQSPPDPNIPSCMGCERNYRMQTIDKQDSFSTNMFVTNVNVDNTYDFYVDAMRARGWQAGTAQTFMDRIANHMPELREVQERGRVLSLERNGETMQIAVIPDPFEGARVISTHEAEGAQMLVHDDK